MKEVILEERVLRTIKKYDMLSEGTGVVVALSGGADSVALFHFLLSIKEQFGLDLTAVHVNHNIRGDAADTDEKFCAGLCGSHSVPIEIFSYDIMKIAKEKGITEEEAGREMRYRAFYETLKKYSAGKIAVAHNKNDQAETLIMRLVRGTGLKGIAGIPPVRNEIIRPLIETERADIEKYCAENGLAYRNDLTNELDVYTRNKIRNHIIPFMQKEMNPSLIETLSRTSQIAFEENEFLDGLAAEAYQNCVCENGYALEIDKLEKYQNVIIRRVLRLAYGKAANSIYDISYEHINLMFSLLTKPSGKRMHLPCGVVVERRYNKLFIHIKEAEPLHFCYALRMNEFVYVQEVERWFSLCDKEIKSINIEKNNRKLINICTKHFNYDKITNGVMIRTRLPGDIIYFKSVGTKKIKDFFIDVKIDRQERQNKYFVADDKNIIWIVDWADSDLYKKENAASEAVIQIWEDIK